MILRSCFESLLFSPLDFRQSPENIILDSMINRFVEEAGAVISNVKKRLISKLI